MIFVRYYLWIVPHAILATLVVLAWHRGWHKRLPIFFVFAVFGVLQFLALFAVSRILPASSIAVYHWTLIGSSAVGEALELGVLFELAGALLLRRVSLTNSLRIVMKWTLAGLVLVAATASASFAEVGLLGTLRIFSVLDFSASLIEAGLLLAMFLFSNALRVSWRSWPTGVALGFGISACLNLATAALRAQFGNRALLAVDVTQMAAFHVAVLVWLVYLLLPERSPKQTQVFGESDIRFWDQELQRMAGR
jgi:hypothetical protein